MSQLKSVFTIILAGCLYCGYYQLPALLGKLSDGSAPLLTAPGHFTTLSFQADAQAPVVVQRDQHGNWQLAEAAGKLVPADQDRIQTFLQALTTAPAVVTSTWETPAPVVVMLAAPGQASVRLELGKRLQPFKRQRIRLDGVTYAVDWDFSSTLGLWHDQPDAVRTALAAKTLWHLSEPIVRMQLDNPFASYDCQRLDEVVVDPPRDPGTAAEEPVMRWTCKANGKPATANLMGLHLWQRQLSCLPVEPAVAADTAFTPQHSLRLTTASGQTLQLQASAQALLVRLDQTPGLFRMEKHAFARAVVTGRNLARDLPQVHLDLSSATAVLAERPGVNYELRRDSQGLWQMTKPRVALPIYIPEAVPGEPKPVDAVTSYLQSVSHQYAIEALSQDPARRQMVLAAMRQPAARLRVQTNAGKSHDLTMSQEVAGTGCRFLKIDQLVMVVQLTPDILVPEQRSFFEAAF